MGYHGTENKSGKKKIRMGKKDVPTGYFPCCFSVSKNSTILVLWDLFYLCSYPYLAPDIGDWGRAGS